LPGTGTLPSVAETLSDFFVGALNVMVASIGTPDAVIRSAVEDKGVSAKFADNGAFTRYTNPATDFEKNRARERVAAEAACGLDAAPASAMMASDAP
jgi:hypothetical protein